MEYVLSLSKTQTYLQMSVHLRVHLICFSSFKVIFFSGTDRGYVGMSLIGAGVGIACAIVLVILGLCFIIYNSQTTCRNRRPSSSTKVVGDTKQTEVTLISPETGPMIIKSASTNGRGEWHSSSSNVAAGSGIGSGKSSLIVSSAREPDVVRSLDGKTPTESEGRFAPLVLTPLQVR